MRKVLLIGVLIFHAAAFCFGQTEKQEMLWKDIPPWFQDAKFGVFVHFGENGHFRYFTDQGKVSGREHNPEAYTKGAELYTLNAAHVAQWVDYFKKWGARYAVLTTNHRPGFSLWDTKVNKRNIVDMSPCKLDVVKVWTEELRKADIKVGYYYSHYDWGDADFIKAKNPTSEATIEQKDKAWERYLKKRDKQVEELVTNYGKIDLIWWDEDWCAKDYIELGSDKMLDIVFNHQPDIVINNRARHPWRWHYSTPEKFVPLKAMKTPWETCDNLTQGNGWGYNLPNGYDNYKTPQDVLFTFLEVLSRGGNYLINIGPNPNGTIPAEELEIMNYVGDFVQKYSEAIYGTTEGVSRSNYGGPSTRKGNVLYLFAVERPIGELTVKGVNGELSKVTSLKGGEELSYRYTGGRPGTSHPGWIRIKVPRSEDKYPEVYKLEFNGEFDY